jgi:hypothetical protein
MSRGPVRKLSRAADPSSKDKGIPTNERQHSGPAVQNAVQAATAVPRHTARPHPDRSHNAAGVPLLHNVSTVQAQPNRGALALSGQHVLRCAGQLRRHRLLRHGHVNQARPVRRHKRLVQSLTRWGWGSWWWWQQQRQAAAPVAALMRAAAPWLQCRAAAAQTSCRRQSH